MTAIWQFPSQFSRTRQQVSCEALLASLPFAVSRPLSGPSYQSSQSREAQYPRMPSLCLISCSTAEGASCALAETYVGLDRQFLRRVASVPLEKMKDTMELPPKKAITRAGAIVTEASGSVQEESIATSPFIAAVMSSSKVRVRLGSVTSLLIGDHSLSDCTDLAQGINSEDNEHIRAAFFNASVQAAVSGGKERPPCSLTLATVSLFDRPAPVAAVSEEMTSLHSKWLLTYFSLLSLPVEASLGCAYAEAAAKTLIIARAQGNLSQGGFRFLFTSAGSAPLDLSRLGLPSGAEYLLCDGLEQAGLSVANGCAIAQPGSGFLSLLTGDEEQHAEALRVLCSTVAGLHGRQPELLLSAAVPSDDILEECFTAAALATIFGRRKPVDMALARFYEQTAELTAQTATGQLEELGFERQVVTDSLFREAERIDQLIGEGKPEPCLVDAAVSFLEGLVDAVECVPQLSQGVPSGQMITKDVEGTRVTVGMYDEKNVANKRMKPIGNFGLTELLERRESLPWLGPIADGCIRLFHGTSERRAQRILVDRCVTRMGPNCDFGPAFYTTPSVEYAINWACSGRYSPQEGLPTVLVIDVPERIPGAQILDLQNHEEWAEVILRYRRSEAIRSPDLRQRNAAASIVVGSVTRNATQVAGGRPPLQLNVEQRAFREASIPALFGAATMRACVLNCN